MWALDWVPGLAVAAELPQLLVGRGAGVGGGVGVAVDGAAVGEAVPRMTSTVAVASGTVSDSVPGPSHAARIRLLATAAARMIVHRERRIEITMRTSWRSHEV